MITAAAQNPKNGQEVTIQIYKYANQYFARIKDSELFGFGKNCGTLLKAVRWLSEPEIERGKLILIEFHDVPAAYRKPLTIEEKIEFLNLYRGNA